MEKASRQSGIELLRIIAALFVVVLHYNDGRAFIVVDNITNKYFLFFLESLSICAVDVFILVTGFFLSQNNNRKIGKLISLFFQLILLKELYYVYSVLCGKQECTIVSFLYSLIPNNYFFILYSTLYLISPYINMVLENINNREYKRFLIILFSIFSLFSIVVDIIPEITAIPLRGLSPFGIFGSQQGFNIVNFTILYVIGGYLKRISMDEFAKVKTKSAITYFGSTILIFLWSLLNERFTINSLRSAWCYHNPLVILSAVSLFVLFSQLKFSSKIINKFAGASFFCYLIHPYLLNYIKIALFVNKNPFILFSHILISSIGIYLVSFILNSIYQYCSKFIFTRLDKLEIPYFDKEVKSYE